MTLVALPGLDSAELTCPVRSDRHDVHQVAEAIKVVGVAGVKPGRMSVGGRRYQQVHRSRSRLTSSVNNGRCHLAVARRHGIIYRQRVELTLNDQQAPQPLRAHLLFICHQNPEVQFGQCDCADSQLAIKRLDIRRNDHTGV